MSLPYGCELGKSPHVATRQSGRTAGLAQVLWGARDRCGLYVGCYAVARRNQTPDDHWREDWGAGRRGPCGAWRRLAHDWPARGGRPAARSAGGAVVRSPGAPGPRPRYAFHARVGPWSVYRYRRAAPGGGGPFRWASRQSIQLHAVFVQSVSPRFYKTNCISRDRNAMLLACARTHTSRGALPLCWGHVPLLGWSRPAIRRVDGILDHAQNGIVRLVAMP